MARVLHYYVEDDQRFPSYAVPDLTIRVSDATDVEGFFCTVIFHWLNTTGNRKKEIQAQVP